MQPEQNIPAVQSSITKLPIELFIEICLFLPPVDLFSLSQVCNKFRVYLCTNDSSLTQNIWKRSRLQFIPERRKPPPEGMNEKKYVELLTENRGCQICKKVKYCKIYWVFKVKCCEECFFKKTIPRGRLNIENKYPREFLDIMPYSYFLWEKRYWIEQIDLAYSQYHVLSEENLQTWLNDKRRIFGSIMEYAKRKQKRDKARLILYPHFIYR